MAAKPLVSTLLLTIVSACSTAPSTVGIQDSFNTYIYPNGSKTFRYEFLRGDRTRPLVSYDPSGGFTDGQRIYSAQELRQRNRRFLEEGAARKLEETAFCRDGFFELDTLISYNGGSLRGECREAATDSDRAQFPNGPRHEDEDTTP